MVENPKEQLVLPEDAPPPEATPAKRIPPNKSHNKKATLDFSQVERLAAAGLTDYQMALTLGISIRSLRGWKGRLEYQEAIKKGQQSANAVVERTLFQRATGFTYEECTYEVVPVVPAKGSRKAEYGEKRKPLLVRRVVKHAIPDTIAIIFYLKNKMPETYKDRNDSNVTSTQLIKVAELEGVNASTLRKAREKVQEVIAKRKGLMLVTVKQEQQS